MRKKLNSGEGISLRFLFVILSILITGVIIVVTYPFLGATSGAFIVIPVALTAWMLGWQAGVMVSLLGMAFNAGIFSRFGTLNYNSTIVNSIVLIGISVLIGWMRRIIDRERKLSQELQHKNKLLSYIISDTEDFSSALLEQATELNRVLGATKAMTTSIELEETVMVIAKEIASSLNASGCTISSWNQETNSIQTLIDYRLEDLEGFDSRGKTYTLDEYPSTRRVLEHGEIITIYIDDPIADPIEVEYIKEQNAFSFLMIPIKFHDDTIGLVEIDDIEKRLFTEENINTAKKLVEHAGIAFHKAKIFDEIQYRLKEQTLLAKAATTITSSLDSNQVLELLCEQLCLALDATSVYISSFEEERQCSTVIAEFISPKATIDEQRSGLGEIFLEDDPKFLEIIRSGIPTTYQHDDPNPETINPEPLLKYDAKTILYLPLRTKELSMGYIEIWDSSKNKEFTEYEINLGKALAEHTAIVMEDRHLREQLTEAETRFRSIAENSPDHVMLLNEDLIICYVNHAFPGSTVERLLGTPLFSFAVNKNRNRVEKILRDVLKTKKTDVYETRYKPKDGNIIYYESRVSPLISGDEVTGLVVTSRDISHRKEMEKQLEYLALHDPLTGLPNRRFMEMRLAETIKLVNRQKLRLEVAILDLDNFKEINDSYGHAVGDQVLIELGKRLKSGVRGSDFPARFGGDEFIVLFVDDRNAPEQSFHERFEAILAPPIQVENHEIFIAASIGYSSYIGTGKAKGGEIIQQADDAMYRLKERKKKADA